MSNEIIQSAIDTLGHRVRDRVTGFAGVATSASLDLYGCVQIVVVPPLNEKGEPGEGRWFDIARLEVTGERVMSPPDHFRLDRGPAEKPASLRF